MKVYLAGFSTPNFALSHALLDKSGLKNGIDQVFHYTWDNIVNTPFYEKNKEIFTHKRGMGFWLWKPFIVAESFKKMQENDILVYCDSGVEIISSLKPVIDICNNKEDILLFQGHNMFNKQYTKRDAFVLMDCDSPQYYDAMLIQASFIVLKKTSISLKFVNEWLDYCQNINILGNLPNVCGKANLPEFIAHREDQSVLSLLQVKYKIKVYRNPSQQGNDYRDDYPESNYPQFLNHHWGRRDGRFAGPLRRFLLRFGIWRY